jgi:hypothetical protein
LLLIVETSNRQLFVSAFDLDGAEFRHRFCVLVELNARLEVEVYAEILFPWDADHRGDSPQQMRSAVLVAVACGIHHVPATTHKVLSLWFLVLMAGKKRVSPLQSVR